MDGASQPCQCWCSSCQYHRQLCTVHRDHGAQTPPVCLQTNKPSRAHTAASPPSPGPFYAAKLARSHPTSQTNLQLYLEQYRNFAISAGRGKKMAFSPCPPSGAQCLGLHSRVAVSQQYFGRVSLSQVLVWCVGGQELTSEKQVPFLKLNLISCRCVSTKPINFLSMPK